MEKPIISVIMPSYNHEKFIRRAIESVLNQDFQDYEFLIADDCSPDNSRKVIDLFEDKRIKRFYFNENKGAVDTLNFLIEQSKGKYIALINSDDYWKQSKLSEQFSFMEDNDDIAACFTWADIVDENENLMDKQKVWYADVFKETNKTQGKWLKHFYTNGNCICHPSILVRKEVYDKIGFYNPILRQLPDFDMWIRLIKCYKIHIIEKSLVCHRRTFTEVKNTSAETPENAIRGINELTYIFSTFFEDMPDEVFIDGFKEDFLLNLDNMTHEHLECEKAFILQKGNYAGVSCPIISIDKLGKLLMNNSTREILKRDYVFKYNNYYDITGSMGIGALAMDKSVQNDLVEKRKKTLFEKILRRFS